MWREKLAPAVMDRVALVAPEDRQRQVLAAVADEGVVEFDAGRDATPGPAAAALERTVARWAGRSGPGGHVSPRLAADAPDLEKMEAAGMADELAGEAEVEGLGRRALHRYGVAAVAGWCPRRAVGRLADRLAPLGGAVVTLRRPPGSVAPTLIEEGRAGRAFQPLVDTYGTVPYHDVNPSVIAGLAYVAMFGMMFGDVGHGLVLVAAGILLGLRRPRRWSRYRRAAPFVVGAGVASAGFGVAYGEWFGPTGLVPALWLNPLDDPTTLLAVAVATGGGMLALSFALGTLNRWREGGAAGALLATSGGAGAALYAGLAAVGLGWFAHSAVLEIAGALVAGCGLVLGFAGAFAAAGGRAGGALQAAVETFDATVRLGANTVSFARLAAFGLTHAALGMIVWEATTGMWGRGLLLSSVATAVFLVGNGVTFALEGLVAAIQALRLEYYEMFSRIFVEEGRPFRPWHVPMADPVER